MGTGGKGEQLCAVSGVGFGAASGCRWSLRWAVDCGNVAELGVGFLVGRCSRVGEMLF